uniref:Pentraxin-related protein PTX3 n=1 Tax=Cyprinus carpio carpio TaxID=630221 RepID=A0A8C1C8Z7_CYPCA
MYAPRALLALCLPCFFSGNVFGYEYGEDYSDSYYNEISNGERLQTGATQIPCTPQDLSRWNKLFIMLEDSQMKQDMLLHQNEDMVKVEVDSIQKELHKLNNNKACVQLREAADTYQAQNNETLQQLIHFSKNQATRLTKLESSSLLGAGLGQVAMKSFSAYPKEQEASNADGGKLERALMATVADLQRVHAQLALFQRATAHRFLPSGCEMALLFPMRSKHIFAEVIPSMSMSLQSFTICLWAKVTQTLNKTVLFSYGTKKNPQELQLLLARHSVLLTVGGETHLVEAHSVVTDGQWGHFCAAWSSEQGLATLWVNGDNVARVPGVAEGHVLPSNGFILLGQERSRSGIYRDLDSSVAFTGKMTGVNMWDHVLDAGRIKEYANQDGSCDSRGNVIGWGVSEIIPHGGSQYIN